MSVDQLLDAFLSPVNATRKAAEATLEQLKRGAPDQLPLALLQTLRSSPEPAKRQLAAVLLRKTVLWEERGSETDDGSNALWYKMSAPARQAVATELLAAATVETSDTVRRPLNHTLAEVAGMVMGDGSKDWPELWTAMHGCATSAVPGQQESAFILFEMLAAYVSFGLKQHRGMFSDIFKARLTDAGAPARVRVAAAKAAVAQLTCADSTEDASKFGDLLPATLQALAEVAAAPGQEEHAREIAGTLIEVAQNHATLFRRLLPQALGLLLSLAGNAAADNELRRLCVEVALTLGEQAGGMVRKLPGDGYVGGLLPVLMGMLLEHGDDQVDDAEWEATSGEEDAYGLGGDAADGDGCNVPVAEEALERLGGVAGAKKFLPSLAPLVREFLGGGASAPGAGADAWKRRFAGLSAVSQTASLMEGNEAALASVAAQVAPLAGADPSPRVRWNAMYTLGNFCSYCGPDFQLGSHALVAPALVRGLGDGSVRVRTQAATSVIAFTDAIQGDVDDDALAPYLRDLFGGLFALLSLPPGGLQPATAARDRFAREQAITAVSALCNAARGLAAPFYDVIVPGLQGILGAADPLGSPGGSGGAGKNDDAAALGRHTRLMRGKALECLTVLGAAVGRERFRADALAAMGGIGRMIAGWEASKRASVAGGGATASSSPGDDTLQQYTWQAVGRIAATLDAADFAPFLPALMPPLLAAAAAEPKAEVVSAAALRVALGDVEDGSLSSPAGGSSDGDDDDDDDDGFVHVETAGGVAVKVRTSDLEEKLTSVETLAALLEELSGPAMAPYAGAAVDALLRALRSSGAVFSDLRGTAACGLADALKSAASALPGVAAAAVSHAVAAAAPHSPGGAASSPVAGVTPDASAFVAMLTACVDELQNCLKDEDDVDGIKRLLGATAAVVEAACTAAHFAAPAAPPSALAGGAYVPLLAADGLRRVTVSLLQAAQAAFQRRAVRKAELVVNAEDADDEAREEAARRDKDDEDVLFGCIDALGKLAKTHGSPPGAFLPLYSELVAPRVRDMSHPASLASDRKIAVFLIDDILEFVADAAVCPPTADNPAGHYAAEYVPVLVRCAREADDAVRQAAVYGLGAAAAALSPAVFAPHLTSVLVALSAVVERLPSGKRGAPEDNAVTALGKVLIHQYSPAAPAGAPVPRAELAAGFVKHLPLSHDNDEARVAAQMLCTWLEAGDADVLAVAPSTGVPDPARLAAILRNLGACLRHKLVRNDELVQRIGAVLARLQRSLPAATLGAVWAALPGPERDALAVAAAGATTAAGGSSGSA